MTSLEHRSQLDADELAAVIDLLTATADADGVSPVGEHVLLHLRHGADRSADNILARDAAGTLVGYAHLDPTDAVEGAAAELAVHPDHRRQGIGGELVRALEGLTGDRRLRLWAHGRLAPARTMAERLGYTAVRVLWQMRRSLLSDLPTAPLPDGLRLRSFVVGRDEAAWTELNNRAFVDHPDQGGWTDREIKAREAEPWFDPAGFLLAVRPDYTLAGFHWTKVHGGRGPTPAVGGDGAPADHAHDPIGEVYALGTDPDDQHRGLGAALTVAGLRYLRGRGLAQVMLYVDESNGAAVRLYERLGFSRWDADVMYRRG